MEIQLADDVGEIGQCDRHRRFGRETAAEAREQIADDPRQREADRDATGEADQEGQQCLAEIGLFLAGRDAEQNAEQGDRRGVVEEAFALDQNRESPWCADVAEDADDGSRIRRCNDGTEQEAGDEILPGEIDADRGSGGGQSQAGNGRADHDRHDRQQQDGGELVDEPADLDGQAGDEKQRRQEDDEESVRRNAELPESTQQIAEHAEAGAAAEPMARRADGDAEAGQQDRMRNPHPLREWDQEADGNQQDRNGQNRKQYVLHRVAFEPRR